MCAVGALRWISPLAERTAAVASVDVVTPADVSVVEDRSGVADSAAAAADAGAGEPGSTADPTEADDDGADGSAQVASSGRYRGEFDSAIVNGFQIATSAGPLCDEPMAGVAFLVEAVGVQGDADEIGMKLTRLRAVVSLRLASLPFLSPAMPSPVRRGVAQVSTLVRCLDRSSPPPRKPAARRFWVGQRA